MWQSINIQTILTHSLVSSSIHGHECCSFHICLLVVYCIIFWEVCFKFTIMLVILSLTLICRWNTSMEKKEYTTQKRRPGHCSNAGVVCALLLILCYTLRICAASSDQHPPWLCGAWCIMDVLIRNLKSANSRVIITTTAWSELNIGIQWISILRHLLLCNYDY